METKEDIPQVEAYLDGIHTSKFSKNIAKRSTVIMVGEITISIFSSVH